MKTINKQKVLITGGTSGIGLAISLVLVHQGYHVFATTRSLFKTQDRKDLLEKLDDEFLLPKNLVSKVDMLLADIDFIEMDVTQEDSVKKAIEEIVSKTGGTLDVLINNAGFGIFGSIEEISVEDVRRQFETNVFGYLYTIQNVLPIMRKQRYGKIINISSLAGEISIPFQGHYSATKFAIEAFTQALKIEVKPWNIFITSLQPSDIRTQFNENTLKYYNHYINSGSNKTQIPILPESPYFDYVKRCWCVITQNVSNAPSPFCVANKVLKLVTKKGDLKMNYSVGLLSQRIMVKLLKPLLPHRVSQKLIELSYKVF